MWKALKHALGGAAVLTGCLVPAGAAAQETVYADKVAIGTFTATTSPLTVVGLPGTGATGGILRTGTGGLIGTGPLVVGDIPGVFTQSDANETITGAWTFTNGLTSGAPIVFGTAVAPPTSTTRSVGTRLVLYPNVNVPPGSPNYDFAIGMDSGTAWFSVPNSIGTRWAFYADDTDRAEDAVPPQAPNHLVAELTASRIFMPGAGYAGSLGLFNRKWGTVYGGELNIETLVLQDTLASTNGRQIIGVSASVLTLDLIPAATWIHVKHPAFRAGDIVLLESAGKVEWLAILSTTIDCRNTVAGTQPCDVPGDDYAYTVTRNLDGSGLSTFYAGDTVFNTGAPGDGMLDLYAQRSSTSTGYAGYVLSDRPQAYYRMNGVTGATGVGGGGDLTMVDASGNGHDGAVPGGLTWSRPFAALVGTVNADPAFLTGGAPLPGGTGYFVVPRPAASPNFAGDLTIEFLAVWDGSAGFTWVLYTGALTGGNLAVSNGTVILYFGDMGGAFQQISPAGCTLTSNVTTHIALTRSQHSREIRCYKNGAEVGRSPYAATPAPIVGTGDLSVGNSFPGYLDEIAIWNRVLPPDRIAAHYGRRLSNSTSTGNALAAGPSVAVKIRNSAAYNDLVPRAVFGNLLGDYGFTTTTYGLALGNPAGANLIATGTTFAFRDGTTETLVMQGDHFAMGDPAPTGLDTGIGLWFAYNNGNPTFRVGNPDGSRLRWDGTNLSLGTDDVTIDSRGITMNSTGPPVADERRFQFLTSCGGAAGAPYMQGYTEVTSTILNIEAPYVAGCIPQVRLAAGAFFATGAADIRLTVNSSTSSTVAIQAMTTTELYAPRIIMGASPSVGSTILPPAPAADFHVVVQHQVTGAAQIGQITRFSGLHGSYSLGGCTWLFYAGIVVSATCP